MKGVTKLAAYNTCPLCGAHLDPNEKCDCEYRKALDIVSGEHRKPVVHTLKIQKKFFNDIVRGYKKFELRRFDRDFKVGDKIFLSVYENDECKNLGIIVKISYILSNCPQFGLHEDYCILGIEVEK